MGVYEFNPFEQLHLMRVKDNELYWDWPWGRGRLEHYKLLGNNGATMVPVSNRTDKYEEFMMMLNVLR